MNFLSYWGFEDLYETVTGIYLQDKTPLHKNFVILRNFIRLNFVWKKFCLIQASKNLMLAVIFCSYWISKCA